MVCNIYEDIVHILIVCPRYAPLRCQSNLVIDNFTCDDVFSLLCEENDVLKNISVFLRAAGEMQKDVSKAEMLPRIPVRHYRKDKDGGTKTKKK